MEKDVTEDEYLFSQKVIVCGGTAGTSPAQVSQLPSTFTILTLD